MLDQLSKRTANILREAGIVTADEALKAGPDGLTALSGIGDATAEEILLKAAEFVIDSVGAADQASSSPADESTPKKTPAKSNKSDETTPDSGKPETAVKAAPPPEFVWIRLEGLSRAVVGGRATLQHETRRVRFSHAQIALQEYPGAFWVRVNEGGKWQRPE